jgi:azurin
MKTKMYPAMILLTLAAVLPPLRASAAEEPRVIVITAGDSMKYDVTRIEAHPGEKLHILLRNNGTLPKSVMGHNWVLLKAGSDTLAYSTAAVAARSENYEPQSLADRVLVALPLIGARQSADVTFDAPVTPGVYPYLCSFPAHCQVGMRGELVVK